MDQSSCSASASEVLGCEDTPWLPGQPQWPSWEVAFPPRRQGVPDSPLPAPQAMIKTLGELQGRQGSRAGGLWRPQAVGKVPRGSWVKRAER